MGILQGSTGVKFSDVAGIDEAVDELQEVSYFTLPIAQINLQQRINAPLHPLIIELCIILSLITLYFYQFKSHSLHCPIFPHTCILHSAIISC